MASPTNPQLSTHDALLAPTRSTVRVAEVASLEGAFLSSARGIAVVTGIDDLRLPVEPKRLRMLAEAYASVTRDSI